jgi:hypothetical protein
LEIEMKIRVRGFLTLKQAMGSEPERMIEIGDLTISGCWKRCLSGLVRTFTG